MHLGEITDYYAFWDIGCHHEHATPRYVPISWSERNEQLMQQSFRRFRLSTEHVDWREVEQQEQDDMSEITRLRAKQRQSRRRRKQKERRSRASVGIVGYPHDDVNMSPSRHTTVCKEVGDGECFVMNDDL